MPGQSFVLCGPWQLSHLSGGTENLDFERRRLDMSCFERRQLDDEELRRLVLRSCDEVDLLE